MPAVIPTKMLAGITTRIPSKPRPKSSSDLHARMMYVCIVDQEGKIRLHRNMKCDREAFLSAIEPFREDIVVSVECMFAWYWIADFCGENEIPFVLGHALYMKAIHGGKAKNDKIDAQKIALLLRGGLIHQS
jgi:hypothetical protein